MLWGVGFAVLSVWNLCLKKSYDNDDHNLGYIKKQLFLYEYMIAPSCSNMRHKNKMLPGTKNGKFTKYM